MSLQPGTRLGAYEIVSLIGVGGMGEVFRGRDTRLNRDVAIKILPATVARDIAGEPRKRIALLDAQYLPVNTLGPSLKLSPTPDGRRLTYATAKLTSNIWLMEGLNPVRSR